MKNNKGFAVTGILYAILVLFLFLILLILNNFQARKVLFDKQKNNILENLETNELENILIQEFSYKENLQEFITPKEGTYLIEVWGADTNTIKGGYVVGEAQLNQGYKLFITVGSYSETDDSVTVSSVRTESHKLSTIILKTPIGDGSTETGYTYEDEDLTKDISIDPLENTKIILGSVLEEDNKPTDDKNGYIRISYKVELEGAE